MTTIDKYLALITSEHNQKPKFVATVSALITNLVTLQNLVQTFPDLFDVDLAVGQQLDVVGEWIGISRYLQTELPNVFFSLDTPGLGLDQGVWKGKFDSTTGLTVLEDQHYRILIKAKIVANNWNGSIPNAYSAWDTLFVEEGIKILIQDGTAAHHADFSLDDSNPFVGLDYGSWYSSTSEYPVAGGMTAYQILIAPYEIPPPLIPRFALDTVTGLYRGLDGGYFDVTTEPSAQPNIDAVTLALFQNGYFGLKPAGVLLEYVTQSARGLPLFALDAGPQDYEPNLQCPPTYMAGLDMGAWGIISRGM